MWTIKHTDVLHRTSHITSSSISSRINHHLSSSSSSSFSFFFPSCPLSSLPLPLPLPLSPHCLSFCRAFSSKRRAGSRNTQGSNEYRARKHAQKQQQLQNMMRQPEYGASQQSVPFQAVHFLKQPQQPQQQQQQQQFTRNKRYDDDDHDDDMYEDDEASQPYHTHATAHPSATPSSTTTILPSLSPPLSDTVSRSMPLPIAHTTWIRASYNADSTATTTAKDKAPAVANHSGAGKEKVKPRKPNLQPHDASASPTFVRSAKKLERIARFFASKKKSKGLASQPSSSSSSSSTSASTTSTPSSPLVPPPLPSSAILCCGCGSALQVVDQQHAGYVSLEAVKLYMQRREDIRDHEAASRQAAREQAQGLNDDNEQQASSSNDADSASSSQPIATVGNLQLIDVNDGKSSAKNTRYNPDKVTTNKEQESVVDAESADARVEEQEIYDDAEYEHNEAMEDEDALEDDDDEELEFDDDFIQDDNIELIDETSSSSDVNSTTTTSSLSPVDHTNNHDADTTQPSSNTSDHATKHSNKLSLYDLPAYNPNLPISEQDVSRYLSSGVLSPSDFGISPDDVMSKHDLNALETMRKWKHQPLRCMRCYQLLHNGPPSNQTNNIAPSDFLTLLNMKLKQRSAVIIMVIDVWDFNGSIIHNFQKVVGRSPVVLAVNKIDLLPSRAGLNRIKSWVKAEADRAGIRYHSVELVSGLTGVGIERMVHTAKMLAMPDVRARRPRRDIFIVGTANVGKSTLIKKMINNRILSATGQFEQARIDALEREKMQALQQQAEDEQYNEDDEQTEYDEATDANSYSDPSHDHATDSSYSSRIVDGRLEHEASSDSTTVNPATSQATSTPDSTTTTSSSTTDPSSSSSSSSEPSDEYYLNLTNHLPPGVTPSSPSFDAFNVPGLPTTSILPGTTLGMTCFPFRAPRFGRDNKPIKLSPSYVHHFLYDTPGVFNACIARILQWQELKAIMPRRRITPVTFQLKQGQTCLLGALARLDLVEGRDVFITVFTTRNVTCHLTNTERLDEVDEHGEKGFVSFLRKHGGTLISPPFTPERCEEVALHTAPRVLFDLQGRGWMEACDDLVFPGVGWVAITGSGALKIRAMLAGQARPVCREPLMPFEKNYTMRKWTGSPKRRE